MYISRLRKTTQIIDEMKEKDSNTAMTMGLLYKLVRTGVITQIRFGNDWVINVDEVYEYFKTKDIKK